MAVLKGFDPKYKDLPDFILGVTREVWEGRGIGTLRASYAPDIVVRSPASLVVGNEGVIAATLATQAEFPDRVLLGEDVIWSGSLRRRECSARTGFSAPRRTRGTASYGRGERTRSSGTAPSRTATPATTRIDDEWLVRDQGAMVRQLGWEPAAYARHLIESEGGPGDGACRRSCRTRTGRAPTPGAATPASGARGTRMSSGA